MEVEKNDLRDFPDSSSSSLLLPPPSFRLFLRVWLPLVGYCLLIFFISSLSSPIDLPPMVNADKVLHIGAYGLLSFLFYRAYRSCWPSASTWSTAIASILSAGFYGITDEIHQYFVPGRSADPIDWLADMIGAFLGVAAYQAWTWVQTLRASSS